MTSSNLLSILDNAACDLRLLLPQLASHTLPPEHAGEPSRAFRARGICVFLLEGRAASLHTELQRSGTAYCHAIGQLPDAAKATGRAAPFFDAVACGDDPTAEEIARRSRTTCNRDLEYEEDFLYAHFLARRFFLGGSDAECARLLDAFGAVLGGPATPRLQIALALLAADGDAFHQGLEMLLLEREAHYRAGVAAGAILEDEWATEGALCVEGLALLRLADRLGLPTEDEYLFVPSLARLATATSRARDSWQAG